jgi:hypothetical protein
LVLLANAAASAAVEVVSMAGGGLLREIDDELKNKHGIVLLRSK